MIYIELLKMTVEHTKVTNKLKKLEARMKQEQTTSKTHLKQIKRIETELVNAEVRPEDTNAIQKILDEKNELIRELKEKLRIPVTQVIQTQEFAEKEDEKNTLQLKILSVSSQIIDLKK